MLWLPYKRSDKCVAEVNIGVKGAVKRGRMSLFRRTVLRVVPFRQMEMDV